MTVDYLGFHINALTYISLLLFALIIFVVIMLATEKERQRRHIREMHRIKHMKDMKKADSSLLR